MSYALAVEQLSKGCAGLPIYVVESIYDACALRDMALMCGASAGSNVFKNWLRSTNYITDEAFLRWDDEKRKSPRPRVGRPLGPYKPRYDPAKATPRLPEKEWYALRGRIFRRDGYVCNYCGTDDAKWAIDHVVPLSRGGTNEPDNLVVACFACNSSKNDKLLTEWQGRYIWRGV